MYPTIKLFSHSSVASIASCPRRYQLNKLMEGAEKQSSIHLTYGTVVGLGLAEYFMSGNVNKAKVMMLAAWDLYLWEEGAKGTKSLFHAFMAIDKLASMPELLDEYKNCKVPFFNDKPAVELSFCIDLGNDYYYRGFIDLVLYDEQKDKYIVIECKTTGMKFIDEAAYANSDQAVAYGVVLDLIAKDYGKVNNYNVDYLVYSSTLKKWEHLPFTKTAFSRVKWLADLLTLTEVVDLYEKLPYFPTNGSSCVTFNTRCIHYGICQLPTERLVDMNKLVVDEFDWAKELGKWQFHFNYTELLVNEKKLIE